MRSEAIAILLVLASCAARAAESGAGVAAVVTPPPAAAGAAAADPAAAADYEIGSEDLLEVSVFELPDLKRTVRVAGDGTITLPLLGAVEVAGLTQRGVEERLRSLLQARYLEDPQISVFVREHRSRRISVIGAVRTPGSFEMLGVRSLLQALGEAGGLTREAGRTLFVLRGGAGGRQERIEIDLIDLAIHGNPALNIELAPGDVINVPVDQPVQIYVNGAVKTPGRVEGRGGVPMTLLQAITQAGGATNRANERAIVVLRRDARGIASRTQFDLKDIKKGRTADPILQDGDVVVVPEAWF